LRIYISDPKHGHDDPPRIAIGRALPPSAVTEMPKGVAVIVSPPGSAITKAPRCPVIDLTSAL